MSASDTPLRLRSPHDIAAVIPYLIGFEPATSLVCLVMRHGQATVVTQLDLSIPVEDPRFTTAVGHNTVFVAENATEAALVGYGDRDQVEAATTLFTAALATSGVPVLVALRVTDDRIFCLDCDGTCPTDGIAYQPATSPVAAQMVYRGGVALPSRTELARQIDPGTGPRQQAVDAATDTACQWLADHLGINTPTPDDTPAHRPAAKTRSSAVQRGVEAVQAAYQATSRGQVLTDDEVGWLTALLLVPEVRDHAWVRNDGTDQHRSLWTDITRRATPELAAAPACLLAITAGMAGDGAMARIATNRALQVDPDYSLARLLDQALKCGLPPEQWRKVTAGFR